MSELDGRLAVLNPHLHDGVPLAEAARRAGVPRRTATRWLAAHQANSLDGLRRLDRADRGGRRLPKEMIELIEGMALRRPPPKAAEVHRAVSGVAAQRGWPPVSYPVVRRIIAGLDRGLVALAHGGAQEYRDDFELVMRREATHPNDIWQADHTELDVMILDGFGQPVRPWLTVILDDRSRAIAGFTMFTGDPSALQTALALRQAIWRKSDPAWPVCGVPAVLYSDHGGDFTSTHIAQVCADLKTQLIHSTPGKPRGRGKVERLFGTITTELLPTLPGHIPHGNRGRPVTPAALTLSELDAAVGRYIVDTYHHRVHPETGQTPLARWSVGDWFPRMPDSPEALDLLLLTVVTPRKVQRDGIHCHGLRYFSITLAPYVGEPVTVRYDPRDLAEIRVYHRDKFLCRAVSPEIASVTVSLQDLQTARNQRRRELRQQLTARRSLVELLTQPKPESARGETTRKKNTTTTDSATRAATRLKLYRED